MTALLVSAVGTRGATPRQAQISVPLLPTFATGAYVPTEPLTASGDTMLTQLLA